MSRAEVSICATAMVWRVDAHPGRFQARKTGKPLMAPPRKIAAQTCTCDLARRADPGPRRYPQRRGYPGQPLKHHQPRKHAVGPLMNLILRFLKKRRCPLALGDRDGCG